MTPRGKIERLCGHCDTPLVTSYCPSCAEIVPTYPWPHGEPSVFERAFGRIQRKDAA